MAKKTLCIDLSDGHVALLLLHQSGSRRTAGGLVTLEQPQPPDPASVARAVADAVDREGMEYDNCVLVLDSAGALYREFVLPFSARPQLERTLLYELEEDLPLDLADTVTDFTRIKLKDRSSRVCAAVYGRRGFVELLQALDDNGLDPVRVEPEACALAAAAAMDRKQFPDKALLLDLGRTRTMLAFLLHGSVAAVRVLDQGEEQLPDLVQADIQPDALRRILTFTDFSVPPPEGSDEAAVKAGLEAMADEAARFAAHFEETSEAWPGPVFFCGELASVKGLREVLMSRLDREAFALSESRSLRAAIGMTEAADFNAVAACLGAGLPGGGDGRMNFRKGEFAPRERRRPMGRALGYAAVLAALVLVCWGVLAGTRLHRESRALAAYEAAMDTVFTQAVPEVQGEFSRTQQVSILQGRINRLGDAAKTGQEAVPSFLQDLLAIHAAVDAGLDVVLDRLTHDARRTSMDGTAGSFQMVETLRNALATSGRFPQVDIKGAATDKKTGRVRFEIELPR